MLQQVNRGSEDSKRTELEVQKYLFFKSSEAQSVLHPELTFFPQQPICQLICYRIKCKKGDTSPFGLNRFPLLLFLTYGLWKEWSILPKAGYKQGSTDDVLRGRGNTRVSGSSFKERGWLTMITSREDPRWRCQPHSWPTSFPRITCSNLSNLPSPLFLLSQPCNYVHFSLATLKDTRFTWNFHTDWTAMLFHGQHIAWQGPSWQEWTSTMCC